MAKLIGLEEMKKELENLKGEKYRVTINDSIISSGYVDEVVLENGRLIVKSRTGNKEPFTEERVKHVILKNNKFEVVYNDKSKTFLEVFPEPKIEVNTKKEYEDIDLNDYGSM